MALPSALTQACQQGRLLLVWGELPFPLAADHPQAERYLILSRWQKQAESLPLAAYPLPELPPLPILGLDPTDRLEQLFAQTNCPLQVVRTRHDVLARNHHSLLKLAGDLAQRAGVIHSREAIRSLLNDADKRYLLDEAQRRVGDAGVLLLVGCEPTIADFQAWWSVLAPIFREADIFALGDAVSGWPTDVTALPADFGTLKAGLWAAQLPQRQRSHHPPRRRPKRAARSITSPFNMAPVWPLEMGRRSSRPASQSWTRT